MLNQNNLIYVFIGDEYPKTIIENSIFIPFFSFNSLSNELKNDLKKLPYLLYTNDDHIKSKLENDYNIYKLNKEFMNNKKIIKTNIVYKKYLPVILSFFLLFFLSTTLNYFSQKYMENIYKINIHFIVKNVIFFILFLILYTSINEKIVNRSRKLIYKLL